MITSEQFKQATGREPEYDDMERVNCADAGQIGHYACGWCRHDRPYFTCAGCMKERCQPSQFMNLGEGTK